ncbi:MAG TPA: hypothetical protein VML75_14865 [Kofleriaceae bacterium]|nr:hypothetical protein [Kofleriaceae bacterium]
MTSVALDRPDRTFLPGELITGRGPRDVPIKVRCVCRTSGRGDAEEGAAPAVAAAPDGTFRLAAPGAPASFVGEVARWDWFLEAIDAKGDVIASVPIAIRNPPGLEVRAAQSDASRARAARRETRALRIVITLLTACGVAMVHGLMNDARYWIAGLVVGLLLLPSTVGLVLSFLTSRKIGHARIAVVQEGDHLACTVSLAANAKISAVRATLQVRERTQRHIPDQGPDEREHVIHHAQIQLATEGSGEWRGRLPIPTGPASVSWASSQISWHVYVRVVIPRFPDDERSIALVALPSSGPGAEHGPRWVW